MRRLIVCVALLGGCAVTTEPTYQPRADYRDFNDATWLPETTARHPVKLLPQPENALAALRGGIHVFDGTHETVFQSRPGVVPGRYLGAETRLGDGHAALSWASGSDLVYRKGRAMTPPNEVSIEPLPNGRVKMTSLGNEPFEVTVRIQTYDIAGKRVRDLLRDTNNMPAPLAWYADPDAKFGAGAKAYRMTYWLGQNEITTASRAGFTGSQNMNALMQTFRNKTPFCLPYINTPGAQPYAITFDPPRTKEAGQGIVRLKPADKTNVFCSAPSELGVARRGTWQVKWVNGTRAVKIVPPDNIASSDLGIQPINAEAVSLGFAEIFQDAKKTRRAVVPVRFIEKNRPIVDFRLRFNDVAAQTLRGVLADAERSKRHHDAQTSPITVK